ncbi:DUF2793 domain-containing protein [Aliihoeflea sp. 40Bstr573]|uniref:DUF2793 domain-containing protein n=1 Tax=Aliihoeflea sp. 40Bstr573 TaxID=2696467 RepID=UPI002094DC18|nr:DUF2793 domain-containing protein [Aliihoeflea sp. 40Bstr573]MCO6387504.1 DUF2793 domain-containing protein [Aliihoeflea sp. 40Bstr573]
MDTTPRHDFPLIMPSQAQKHVTHNEALSMIDARLNAHASSRGLTAPPADALPGDTYVVGAPASGAWAGREHAIAVATGAGWSFDTPRAGSLIHIADENALLVFDGTQWQVQGQRGTIDRLAFNALPDDENRLSVRAPTSLFDGDEADGGHRLKINKTAPAETASVVFQTGYHGRAELGLTGSDAFSIKTSQDGETWRAVAIFDPATGFLGLGSAAAPDCALDVRGHLARVSAPSFAAFAVAATGAGGREYRFAATDDSNGLGGGRFVLFDQNAGTMRIAISPQAFETTLPLKLKTTALAALPDAATSGAGAVVYVPNMTGGPGLAFSDGSVWRRVGDGAAL